MLIYIYSIVKATKTRNLNILNIKMLLSSETLKIVEAPLSTSFYLEYDSSVKIKAKPLLFAFLYYYRTRTAYHKHI